MDATMTIAGPDGVTTPPITTQEMQRLVEAPLDPRLVEAARLVIGAQKCAVSFVQRELLVGYSRAVQLVEALEAEGVVSPANHVGKRAVLVTDLPAALAVMGAIRDSVAAASVPMREGPEDVAVRERVYRVAGDELRAFVERYERLAAEKADIAEAQKDVMAEAKALRKIIALRKRDADDISEEEAVLRLYRDALGMA